MNVALIQRHVGHDLEANLRAAEEAMRAAAGEGANLIAFPELAFTPFYPQFPAKGDVLRLAEPVPGPITERFQELAAALQVVTIINLFERDGERAYDCSPVIDADGALLGRTRMVHITEYPYFHEQQYYSPSDLGAPVFSTRAGRVGVAICYDRHFPEYMRALGLGGADLVVVPQAGVVDEWPAGFFEGELCTAAFQNGYFVALCNRVGQEERLTFAGESFVCGPEGGVRARAPRGADATLIVNIDLADTSRSHARRVLLNDRRPDQYLRWL